MRVVLQNNSTSLYFGFGHQWTPRFKDAQDFGSLENVLEFYSKEEMTDVQVVIILERSQGVQFCPFPPERLLHARSQGSAH